MKCLVTGAAGFIGSYLVEFLLKERHKVVAFDVSKSQMSDNAEFTASFIEGNILESKDIGRLFEAIQPEIVFHLAAQSYPNVSWEEPANTFKVNVLGTIFLFEEIRARKLDPVIIVPCSSSEYGPSRDGQPITESGEILPSSPYAVSKLAQDHISRLYYEYYGLKVVRCRPFYLIGPRKKGDVSSDFARGIVAIERGQQKELPVGNLDVVRDLLDVRDGVEAFWLLSQQGQPGEVYNVCSGSGLLVRELLSIYKGLAKVEIRVRMDPGRIRTIDDGVKIGDHSKLCNLGWSPKRTIQQTLKDILEYWRIQKN